MSYGKINICEYFSKNSFNFVFNFFRFTVYIKQNFPVVCLQLIELNSKFLQH